MKHVVTSSQRVAYYGLHQGHGFIFRRIDLPNVSVGDTLAVTESLTKKKETKTWETQWAVIGIETRENNLPIDEYVSVLVEPIHEVLGMSS